MESVLVIPDDLLLNPHDLEELLQNADGAAMTVIPDKHMKGTNGFLLTLPMVFPACFGEKSLRAHIE